MSRASDQESIAALLGRTLNAHAVVFYEALAARLGLNATDLLAIQLVAREGEATPSRLADLAGLTTGAITGVLDRLEKAGIVARESDPNDRRRIIVRLVPERARELVDALQPLASGTDELLARYAPGERKEISDYLTRASDLLGVETARMRAAVHGGMVGDTYTAPLAGATRGRFVFHSGGPRLSMNVAPFGPSASARIIMETAASRLIFEGAAPDTDLVTARYDGPLPDVRAADGQVTMRYRRQPFSSRSAQVRLSRDVPWTVELSGGITDLAGSLEPVQLAGLHLEGGANHVKLELPRPSGTVPVRIDGVASSVAFSRPAGVPVMLRVNGGISHLRVDDRRHGQVSGDRRFLSDDFGSAPDRYEIEVLGGASDVKVSTR
jgi:DNA-binding MarR family transcriptional regulator